MARDNTKPRSTVFLPPRVSTVDIRIRNGNSSTSNDLVLLYQIHFFHDIYVSNYREVQIIHIEISNQIELLNWIITYFLTKDCVRTWKVVDSTLYTHPEINSNKTRNRKRQILNSTVVVVLIVMIDTDRNAVIDYVIHMVLNNNNVV